MRKEHFVGLLFALSRTQIVYSFLLLTTRAQLQHQTLQAVEIRGWIPGEGEAILSILQQSTQGEPFNPEGSFDQDCTSESLLAESYDPEDGGCFLVAIDLDTQQLVGVGGLIVGTQIEYQAGGASTSSAQTTAAIRRCCCSPADEEGSNSILKQLIANLEQRALLAQATNIIALAYPSWWTIDSKSNSAQKPTPKLMETLGYEKLPRQLPGVNALQYGKNCMKLELIEQSNERKSTKDLASSAVAIWALTGILMAGFFTVAQLIGFDITMISPINSPQEMETINRGLGRPLSSEDLSQLVQEEKLKRTTLDSNDSPTNSGREWKDLSLEERREEMALLEIINGQDVRIK